MNWSFTLLGFTFYALLGTFLSPFPKPMDVTETDKAIAHLRSKGYLLDVAGVPTLTNTFYEYLNVKQAVSGEKPRDMKEVYKKFIEEAKVPFRPKGYTVNMYSLTGQKAYERILKTPKLDQEKFLLAAQYYYRTTEYPKTIEKYLTDGIWENYYYKLVTTSSAGASIPDLEEPQNTIFL